jgi:hypothetical protein
MVIAENISSFPPIRAAAAASAPVFAAIWNNPDDAAYDAL